MRLEGVHLLVLTGVLWAGCREPGLQDVRAQVRVQPASVDFGGVWVGTQRELSVSVENLGGTSLALTLATDAPFLVSPTRLTLGTGEAQAVRLRFQPRQAGTSAGVLQVGVSGESLEVPLAGEGLPLPECTPTGSCRVARFSLEEGRCVEEDAPEGLPCGGACLHEGVCAAGVCVGEPVLCADDGDSCTLEACDPQVGCTREDRRPACEAEAPPCMAASCGADGACVYTPVADGTLCGEQSCAHSQQCQQGTCVEGPPARVPGSPLCATAVQVGDNHACASLDGGTLACWGADLEKMGPTTDMRGMARPRLLTGATDLVAFAVGDYATCVQGADGGWSCLGDNFGGWLGLGPAREWNQVVRTLTPVPGLAGAVEVEPGYGKACARMADGSLSCVRQRPPPGGYDWDGRYEPVAGMEGLGSLSMESYCECSTRTDGSVWCWYSLATPPPSPLADGGVGQPNEAEEGFFRFGPMQVEGVEDVRAVATGMWFACALQATGEVTCWGNNNLGQQGRAPTEPDGGVRPEPPTRVPGLSGAVGLCAGRNHACALLGDGTLRCWGDNTLGQLGLGVASAPSSAPVTPVGLERVKALECGFHSTCALQEGGRVWCWGPNTFGQAGQGTWGEPPSPRLVLQPTPLTW